MQKTSKSSSCTLGPPILVPSTLPISEASYTTGQKTGIWKLGVLCCRFVDLLHPTSPVEAPAIRQDNTGFSRTGASSESKTWMWKCHFFGDLTGTCFDNVHYGISVSERLRETTKPNSCLWIWVHLSALNDLQAFFQLCPRRTRTEYRTAHWTWASLPSLQPQCRQQDSAQQRQEQNESTNLENELPSSIWKSIFPGYRIWPFFRSSSWLPYAAVQCTKQNPWFGWWIDATILGSKLDKVLRVQHWIVAISAPGICIWDLVFGLDGFSKRRWQTDTNAETYGSNVSKLNKILLCFDFLVSSCESN